VVGASGLDLGLFANQVFFARLKQIVVSRQGLEP
jgi:hypothetical protein